MQQASQHIPQSQWQQYNPSNPINQAASMPVVDEQASRISTYQNPIKSDFGKIKGIEVLSFKEAELEKTLGGVSKFATVGILQVLYFANYDRFVLSLNDWKYALLKRLPITASENSTIGPICYTLPTYNGFYTLTLPKVQHIEGLKNLETIFANNSRFSYKGQESAFMSGGRSPDDRYRSMEYTSAEMAARPSVGGQTVMSQPTEGVPPTLSKGQKWKRGFKKFGFLFTGRMSKKEKLNLNNYQARDIETLKTTNEVMAPLHMYPRREVERWITYNKEIANGLGYMAEGYQEGLNNSFTSESRMRGYGSVDLGQGSLSNPIPLVGGISTIRPSIEESGYVAGDLHTVPAGSTQLGYSKIKWTDKVKAKLPGEHRYYGEKIPGGKLTHPIYHSHTIHPEVSEKLERSIGSPITNPTPGMIGESYVKAYGSASANQSLNVSSMKDQTSVIRSSSPIQLRPVGEAYAQSFGQQSPRVVQSSEYRSQNILPSGEQAIYRQMEPSLRTSGENYNLGHEARIINEQFPSNIQTSEYRRAFNEPITTRPVGERYIDSFENQPTEIRHQETYPATIKTVNENLRYQNVEPVKMGELQTVPTFGETPELREEAVPSTIHTSNRTAGFTEIEDRGEQAFQRTMTPVGETYSSEATVLRESENLPSLAQRIRAAPTKPSHSGIIESSGTTLTSTENNPTFFQRVKNAFTGVSQPETTSRREVTREPIVETQAPLTEMDVIRGQNAHYQG